MLLHQHKRAVGIFTRHIEVKQALYDLNKAGFPLNKVLVITRKLLSKNPIQRTWLNRLEALRA